MNKLVKGAVAAGVATILLIGGGTTLALWNDSAEVAAGQDINSGILTVSTQNGQWSTSPEFWVPGDSFQYTATVNIVAKGDDLKSQLSIDPASIQGDPELVNALVVDMSVTNVQNGTLTPVSGEDNAYTVTPTVADSGTPITADVTIDVELPESVAGLVAQGQEAELGGMQLILQQVTS